MDIENLKSKLDDSEFDALNNYVSDLVGQRDQARQESINGRKGLKSELESLKSLKSRMFEKLGILDEEELETLPDSKGQAEAFKQFESKMKRLERDLQDKDKALSDLSGLYRMEKQNSILSKSISGFDWSEPDVVTSFISSRITWEEDQPFYKADEGKLVSLEEGVKLLATTKPGLLKSRGAGGSGYVATSSGAVKNPWSKESFNLTEQGKVLRENPALAQSLMQSAKSN